MAIVPRRKPDSGLIAAEKMHPFYNNYGYFYYFFSTRVGRISKYYTYSSHSYPFLNRYKKILSVRPYEIASKIEISYTRYLKPHSLLQAALE